ncbi:MAG: hypothetical protein WBF17_15310, partial [Phycisphaerae bacterium]
MTEGLSLSQSRRLRLRWAASAILLAASGLRAENLLPDGSFEKPKPRDRWGLVFQEWGGWIYEQPASFEVGRVARTGKSSCELLGGLAGKIRAYSKEIPLAPGRYRVAAYLRGLSIAEGNWGRPLDFTVQVDGKWHAFKRGGTFGWTPLTYVFDVPAGADANADANANAKKPFRVFFGLWGVGRLWVDDVSLEKVDRTVALTPEPVWGRQEAPIAAPGEIKTVRRCRVCQYRNDASWKRCYACGHELATSGGRQFTTPPIVVFADFEDGKRSPFQAGTAVAEHAASGKYALRVDRKWADISKPMDFSQHDYFHFDVYNPQSEPVRLDVELRDAETKGYWTRVNLSTLAPPGASTITFPTQLFVGEKSRPGRPLLRDRITRFVVSVGESGPVFFDGFRLERLDTASVRFDDLVALDFGPPGSPVMEGFEAADSSLTYTPGRGIGWYAARIWRSFDARQPEALTQDFVCPESGSFRIDLPNGRYRVLMNVESPGAYWGEQQNYRKRAILINGQAVHVGRMDFEAFKKRYFRNARAEDLPGVDPFDAYLPPMDRWQSFDAEVTQGKLEIGFDGANWAFCLSTLIVYPQAKAKQGGRFFDWVARRRRVQFSNNFKQAVPSPTGEKPPAGDYRLFARHFMDPPGAKDGPREGELIDADAGLRATAARGEEAPIVLSLQPAGDVGEISLEISPLVSAKGEKLAADALRPGWLDYRISRVTMDGSVYTVRPRYWRPIPAPAAPGVTRTFWIRGKIPPATAPGPYEGRLTVRPKRGKARSIPLTVTVLPFALDEIADLAVGPWGCNIRLPWYGDDPQTRAWNGRMLERSLRALREAGCTSFSGMPSLHASVKDGNIELDSAEADRQMALARWLGFGHTVSNYGVGNRFGYRPYGDAAGPDVAAAKRAGFADMHSFLAALYGAIDRHAAAKNWLPVAWNLCDEPIGAAVDAAVRNALAHRAVAEGLKRTTFMGATSMRGSDPKDPHYPLVRALPMPSLNLHDLASIGVIRQGGNAFSFYNGADR